MDVKVGKYGFHSSAVEKKWCSNKRVSPVPEGSIRINFYLPINGRTKDGNLNAREGCLLLAIIIFPWLKQTPV